jgi:hypothetical protein
LSLEFQPIEVRRDALIAADWLLEEWPSRLITICKTTGVYSSWLKREFKSAPSWFLDPIKTNLWGLD